MIYISCVIFFCAPFSASATCLQTHFFNSTKDSLKTTVIVFADLAASHADIPVRVNGFARSTEPFNIYHTYIKAGTNAARIPTDSIKFKGMGEIAIKGYGSTPVVFYNTLPDTIKVTAWLLNEMRVADDKVTTNDLKALSAFNSLYRGYENMLAAASQKLQSKTITDQREKLSLFLKDYITYREKFNIFFKYAHDHWPHTYVSDVLPSIFLFNLLDQNDSINMGYIRAHYFDAWQYNNPLVLNNPLIMRQLDLYMSYFGVDDSGKIYKAIDAVNKPLLGSTDKTVKDFIHEYFLIAMMNKSRDNNMDAYMKYLYDNYLEMDICDESATSTDDKSRNSFYKRLRNIPNVQEGKIIPIIEGYTTEHKPLPLQPLLDKANYTLVFIWSSTCTHCEAFKPQVEAFAKAHSKSMQVYAISIDKAETLTKWAAITDARKDLTNWIDLLEQEGQSLKDIYYMGTPSVFLVDKTGKILSRSLQTDAWEKVIQPLNN